MIRLTVLGGAPSPEEPGGGPQESLRSPTDLPPALPKYHSRVGGNHCTVGHVG